MAISDFIEPAIKDYATQATATYSAPIDTSTFTGRKFVAGEDPLQTQAINLAQQGVGSYSPYLQAAQAAQTQGAGALGQAATTLGGIGANIGQAGTTLGGVGTNIGQADTSLANAQSAFGGLGAFQAAGQAAAGSAGNIASGAAGMTGPQAYQPFMSPYQQQVIDATLDEFDRSRLSGQQQIRDAAVGSGNFGGGREGAMMGQYNADSLADRAALQANMLQQGFGQAQQAANTAFNQQGQLGQNIQDFQTADINQLGRLGGLQQAQTQAGLDATREANRLEAFEPYERLGTYGSGVASLFSGNAPFGNQSTVTPNPTPLQTALGTGLVLSEIFNPTGRKLPGNVIS